MIGATTIIIISTWLIINAMFNYDITPEKYKAVKSNPNQNSTKEIIAKE
jgi:hypothetical protein